jgi:hypothetical protein
MTSQVLAKVFKALRTDGISRKEVAVELGITPDDLNQAVFGLAVLPGDGIKKTGEGHTGSATERPPLRLIP